MREAKRAAWQGTGAAAGWEAAGGAQCWGKRKEPEEEREVRSPKEVEEGSVEDKWRF